MNKKPWTLDDSECDEYFYTNQHLGFHETLADLVADQIALTMPVRQAFA